MQLREVTLPLLIKHSNRQHVYWFRHAVDSLLSTLSMKSKCINTSRRTAFYFVKFRAVRAQKVSGIFWSWKTILSSFNELYAVRKTFIPSFVSPAASLKTHYFWASPPSGMISERQFRVHFIHITWASFMVHRTKYSNLMCSRCVYCNYMSVVRAFK